MTDQLIINNSHNLIRREYEALSLFGLYKKATMHAATTTQEAANQAA
jgi:hypothetical protein